VFAGVIGVGFEVISNLQDRQLPAFEVDTLNCVCSVS
jgi:hypothetical protein